VQQSINKLYYADCTTGLQTQASRAAAAAQHSSSGSSAISGQKLDKDGRLMLSARSMEAAFASVCKAYVARPGQPMSRTREEVSGQGNQIYKYPNIR
jgi:hypothetical protein